MIRLLRFGPVDVFRRASGAEAELKDPLGLPTTRQYAWLNAMGCLLVVEPGTAEPLDRRHAAGAIQAARRLRGEA